MLRRKAVIWHDWHWFSASESFNQTRLTTTQTERGEQIKGIFLALGRWRPDQFWFLLSDWLGLQGWGQLSSLVYAGSFVLPVLFLLLLLSIAAVGGGVDGTVLNVTGSLQGSLALPRPTCSLFLISFHRLNMKNKTIEVAEWKHWYFYSRSYKQGLSTGLRCHLCRPWLVREGNNATFLLKNVFVFKLWDTD